MKATVAILICAMVACGARGGEESHGGSPTPQSRPRLDPNSPAVFKPSTSEPSSATASPVVALSPYIVRGKAVGSPTSPLIAIPQGAPAPSGSQFVDALQSGGLLKHTGKTFQTEFLAHGERVTGGFARMAVGYSISW